jgi:hypothetical protein
LVTAHQQTPVSQLALRQRVGRDGLAPRLL